MADIATALVVEDLEVTFRDRDRSFTALSLARLDLRAGTSLAVVGPSGCGKSTLLHVLSGLLPPAKGRVAWNGQDLYSLGEAQRDAWRRASVGFIFQDFELLSELTALENVLLPASFVRIATPVSLRDRASSLLSDFGVPDRRGPVGAFSRGERQRVALARALLFDPPIILADEPTASLDAAAATHVIDVLAGLSGTEGRTLVVATHDPALMQRLDARLVLSQHPSADVIERAVP